MLCSYLYQSICNIVLRRYYCWVYFFLVIKSGKSFVKIGSRSQIARFFLFYCNPHSRLFRTSPLLSTPPRAHTHTHAHAHKHTHTHTHTNLILPNSPTTAPLIRSPPCYLGPGSSNININDNCCRIHASK